MPAALQFALSNPNPGLEDEFNAWYGGDHLIHGVQTPGISAGQRFRRAEGPWPSGKHDYLMIWELDNPAFALAELAKVKGTEEMPISPAINMDTVQPPTMWRRAEVRSAKRLITDTSSRQTIILGLYAAAEGADRALSDSLLKDGLTFIADTPGVIAAEYLTLADEQIRGNARKFPHGLLIEVADEESALPALKEFLSTLPYADKERWMAIVFQPVGKRLTTRDAQDLEQKK